MKKADTLKRQAIIHHVIDTALHILHESDFYNSKEWPVNGVKVGKSLQITDPDCICVGVNPYGYEKSPITGRIAFNFQYTPEKRIKQQLQIVKLLFDYTIKNDLLFEDEFRNVPNHYEYQWFKFTYQE